MFDKKKKIDFVLLVFGSIALLVVVAVSIILYLLFSKYSAKNFVNNSNVTPISNLQPQLSPAELLVGYQKEIQKQIDFVETTDKDITTLSQDLENNLLAIHVPAEEREKFLNVTLQLVRMQKQGLEIDAKASKDKILELLNSLLNYEKK